MNNKEQYIKLINEAQLDKVTKELAIQLYCIGYSEGKAAAFKEALELISYPRKVQNEPH
jgi:hypothetical protein